MLNGNEIEHPSHYTSGDVECIDGIRAALGDEGFKSYCAGNAIKYLWRYRHKGGLIDVRKAGEYLGWLAEDLELDERAEAEIAQEATATITEELHAKHREEAADFVEELGGIEEVKGMYAILRDLLIMEGDIVLRVLGDDFPDDRSVRSAVVMSEIGKRLMPPNTKWPRFEDGKPVEFGDEYLRFDGRGGNSGECATEITICGGGLGYKINGDYQGNQPIMRPVPKSADDKRTERQSIPLSARVFGRGAE